MFWAQLKMLDCPFFSVQVTMDKDKKNDLHFNFLPNYPKIQAKKKKSFGFLYTLIYYNHIYNNYIRQSNLNHILFHAG